MTKKIIIFISLFIAFVIFPVNGSETEQVQKFDAENIIKMICEKVDLFYPQKGIASRITKGLNSNLSSGKYKKIDSPSIFASMITTDMETLSNDKHLDLLFDPGMVSEMKAQKEKGIENTYTASQVETYRLNNYGFKTLKIMEGNVGYLDLQVFFAAKYAGDTAVATMNFFSNCDALIIDLKNNGGGWDCMVNLLLSYFINPEEEVVMKIMRSTIDNTYYPSMSFPYIPGKKMDTIPVYILTSGSTASAAEAFVFRMKHLNKRVSIVGDTTAGAENPVDHQILNNNFILQIPCFQVIYSKVKGGWEGIGIKPDIPVIHQNALEVAYLDALKKLKTSTKNRKQLDRYQWAMDGIEAKRTPLKLKKSILHAYVGKYSDSSVIIKKGNLFYQYKKRSRHKLIPISADYFLVEGADHYRIRFLRNKNQSIILKIIFNDGYIITRTKNN
jgi:hypothetical protein